MYYLFILLFFNDAATTEIYTYCHTLSLHDALPICPGRSRAGQCRGASGRRRRRHRSRQGRRCGRVSRHAPRRSGRPDRKSTRLTPVTNAHLVCRLLLEKKKQVKTITYDQGGVSSVYKGTN